MDDYKYLLDNADSEAVAKYARACIEHGSLRQAARVLGVSRGTIQQVFSRQRQRLGINSDTKGISQYYDKEGNPAGKWVITRFDDKQRKEVMDSMFQAMLDDLPKYKPVSHDKRKVRKDLLNLYPLFDFHIGMRSYPKETGQDWNVKIAQEVMYRFFEYAINNAPDSEECIICLGGDFMHWDGINAETTFSGHHLDADSRTKLVITLAITCVRHVIEMCAKKHKKIYLLVMEGNHDPIGSAWISSAFHVLFDKYGGRLDVNISPNPFYAHEFGSTSLFFHHGHTRKKESADTSFASQFRDIYGRTKYSYGHTGHYHSRTVFETNLMQVYQHGTITAKDSYAARHGFNSLRCAEIHTYSKNYGLCNILPVHIDML